MAILMVREKNQVTLPSALLESAGLRQGDPIEFASLPDGGIAIYPFGHHAQHQSAMDLAVKLSEQIPGIEDVELNLPARGMALREVEW